SRRFTCRVSMAPRRSSPSKASAKPPRPPVPPPPPPDPFADAVAWLKKELVFAGSIALTITGALLIRRWITQAIGAGILNRTIFEGGNEAIVDMIRLVTRQREGTHADGQRHS